jgi:DNA (cytosine-5)-methyltransferase 1
MKKIRLATIFSGIGSVEQAFLKINLGHEIVFACDNGNVEVDYNYEEELNKVRKLTNYKEKNLYVRSIYSSKSRKKNYVELTYLNNYKIDKSKYFYDVRLLDGNDFTNKVDLLVGGSPCQSFSIIGNKQGFEDVRGTLFYDFVRIVSETQPKIFIFENVSNIKTHDKGNTWKVILKTFDKLNYYYKFEILNAKDFGIPQSRKRMFVIGFKSKSEYERFNFPKPIKLNNTLQDFLINNCSFGSFIYKKGKINIIKSKGDVDDKYYLSEKLKKYVLSPGTKNFYHKDAKIDLKIARALLSTQGNSHRSSVNNYVTTNGRIRALTERESLRLMGFSDSFNITVSKSQSYKQSGNSIVVNVLEHLIKELYGKF